MKDTRPNILFLLSDQHSVDYMGLCARKPVSTPNLDALAREGVYFDNAYCQNPLCVPSRASLLTGRYSRNIGLYENRHILEAGCATLPRSFAEAGYETCLVGKSHFNGEQYHGYRQRPYGDIWGQAHQPEFCRTGKEEDESGLGGVLQNSGPTQIPLPMTQTEICVAESVKWLQIHAARGGAPFFLSVNFDKPHFPLRPPRRFFDNYAGKVTPPDYPRDYALRQAVPFVRRAFQVNGAWEHYGRDREVHERALAAYCGCVEWMDDAAGRIIDALDFLGLSENTVVVYTSDHGEMAGEKGAWQKTVFFDASARVPLALRWPGRYGEGLRCAEPVGLVDLFPTLCRAADIPVPGSCDGEDLSAVLEEGRKPSREEVFCESAVLKEPEHAGCMIRKGRYKYNLYLDGHNELYDMAADPCEESNLAGRAEYTAPERELATRAARFWEPEKQMERYKSCPMMTKEKHFHLFSNQFITSDGAIYNAKP